MKNLYRLIIAFGFLALASTGLSKPVEVSQILIFEDQGEDSTFQEIPELKLGKKIFCLWKGDDLQAFFIPTLEKHKGDVDSFLAATKRSMAREGAKKVNIEKVKNIETDQGAKILKCTSSFVSQGQNHKSLFYIIPLDGIYQMISVTLTSPDYFDDISKRSDALIKRARIKN